METEQYKNTWIQLPELETTVSDVENILGGLINRLKTAEEKIIELVDITTETTPKKIWA